MIEWVLVNFSNMIIEKNTGFKGKFGFDKMMSYLKSSGYEKCLKRDASFYAIFDEERENKCIWLRKVI
jgi:hypothetical protein